MVQLNPFLLFIQSNKISSTFQTSGLLELKMTFLIHGDGGLCGKSFTLIFDYQADCFRSETDYLKQIH